MTPVRARGDDLKAGASARGRTSQEPRPRLAALRAACRASRARADVSVAAAVFALLAAPMALSWPTAASLATAAGTLVLALATFASVRSSNRSARIAELALQAQRRPVVVH